MTPKQQVFVMEYLTLGQSFFSGVSVLMGRPLQVLTALRLFASPPPLQGRWIMPRFWQSTVRTYALSLRQKICDNRGAQM